MLFTGYSCNAKCHFCIDLNKREIPDKSTQTLVSEMVKARTEGADYLELIGGETTIRGDFFPILNAARRLGFKDVVVVTNGKMLSYPDFAKKTVDAGVTELIFSIHGHDAKTHDLLVADAGSFEQLLKGIENVRACGFKRIHANSTVVKQNMETLPELGELLVKLKIEHAEFIFVDPSYGGGYTNFEAIVPRISDAAPWMRKCLDVGRKWGTRDWTVRYVPLCHFSDYLDQVSEIREVKIFQTRHMAPDFSNPDVGGTRKLYARVKTERCNGCSLFDRCEGMWREYLKRYGDSELTPIAGA